MARAVMLFPHPLSPTTPRVRLAGMSISTPFTACTVPSFRQNRISRDRISIRFSNVYSVYPVLVLVLLLVIVIVIRISTRSAKQLLIPFN